VHFVLILQFVLVDVFPPPLELSNGDSLVDLGRADVIILTLDHVLNRDGLALGFEYLVFGSVDQELLQLASRDQYGARDGFGEEGGERVCNLPLNVDLVEQLEEGRDVDLPLDL